jgi:hypothetical protein
MPRTPRRVEVQISLRVTPEIYEAIKAVAAAEKRSINRQLELMIEDWLQRRERQAGRSPGESPTTRVADEGEPSRPHGE